ncbi:RNA polymerase sigma factor, partial [Streptomyces sp. UNOB3_S3]|uniref:RNA polymerase sigma factor n=1 Tax=Streptomyces sp. UNOB3_S3 TaxID=2871682 RepID=UPI001E44D620
MMTSRPEPPTHATGAHRAPSSAPRAAQPQVVESTTEHIEYAEYADRAEEYADHAVEEEDPENSPHLDGLFTYCLSVLCDHESAVAALGETLALAERRADRAPAAQEAHRAWLYALARWECLRRLAERGTGDPPPAPDAGARAELALLAWPEAAGTTAEQREALELAVRHGLAPHEVAAVLRLDLDAARVLLSSAACEVERTRTALAVVESGRCQVVTRFVGDREVLLGAALRRELVRHVDECADCRRTAERAVAGEPWPGTAASPAAALPVLRAPRAAAHAAMRGALDARPPRRRASAQRAATPRFDRGGFPLTPKDRAARRSRLRSRAVTTTVVATVVAAPILALWAAYRGTPLGEGTGAAPVSATETDSLGGSPHEGFYEGAYADPYEATAPAGPTRRVSGTPGPSIGHRFPDVSVAVLGPDGGPAPATRSGPRTATE